MEELYNDLYGKGLYTKSLQDFEQQFTGKEDILFNAIGEDYASDLEEFKQKYFSPGKTQGPAKDAAAVGPLNAADLDSTSSDGSLDFLELDKTFKGTLEEPANPMYQLVDTLGKQKEVEIENEWVEESLLPKKTGYKREDGVTKKIEVPIYPKGYEEYMKKAEGNLDLAKKMYLKDKKSEIVGEELSKYISDKNSDDLEEYFDEYKDLKIEQTEKLSDVVDINSTSLKYLKDETVNAVNAIQKIDKAFERADLLSRDRIKELIDYRENYLTVAKQAIKKSQDLVNTNTKLAYLLKDEEKFIDAAKRSYDFVDILGYSALASTGEMIAGAIDLPKMFVASTLSGILDQDLDDVDRAVVAAFAPFQFADNLRKGSTELREGIAKPISISDVENMSDFGEWAGSLIGNMAPQIALGIATGGGGWAASTAMGVSSAAGKYSDLLKEMEEGAEYTTAQVLSSALISGAAETLSEKITFGQFKGIKQILKRNPKSLKAAQEYIQNNIAKGAYLKTTGQEALSEVAAQLANNMVDINILEKKDVNITDGLLDSLAGGAFMSGVMFKSPAVLANVYHKVRGTEIAEKLRKNAIQITKLDKALTDLEKKESTPENEEVKKGLIESMDKIAKNSLNAMTEDVQLVNFMTKDEKAEIESLNEKKADIESKAKTIFNNKDLDPDIKKQQLDELNNQYKEVTKRRSFLSKVAAVRVNQGKDAKSLQEAWERSQKVMQEFANDADLNIDYIEINSTNFESKIKDLNLTQNQKKSILENNGTFLDSSTNSNINKDIIFINKDLDAAYGAATTVQHEVLHVVLNKVVKDQLKIAGKDASNTQAVIDGMGLKLYEKLSKVEGFNDTTLAKRFDYYLENSNFALEELITVLSEHISETKAKKGTFSAIVEFFKDLYARFTGQQLQLETTDDLLGFVNSYTKMFDAGKIDTDISGAVKEARVKIDLNVDRAQIQKRIDEIRKERGITRRPQIKNIDSKASKYFDDELTQLAKDFEDGVIPEDEYLQRIDDLMDEIEKAEAANEEAEDFSVVKKQPKKAKKQKSELQIELAGKAKIHKELLDRIGNDPNGYNPDDARIWDTIASMVESKSRNYTTAKGDYAPLTNLPKFDMESMVAETQASLVNYIKKFDPSLNNSLYGYVNAQLLNRMRAALKTGKVAGTEFMTDVTEAKGIAYTDEGYVEVKGKEYTRISDSKAFSDELIEKAKADLLRVIRVLKSKIDSPMTINQSISPLMREIIQNTKNMMDADIKVEMGGKKDGKLRKWLQANKKMVIENSTTTFLMGKNNGKVVKGGIPSAIEKKVNGRWLPYPEWIDKKIDRETTWARGNTSGNELARRVPASRVSDADFLSHVLAPTGNPIRGRKEAIAMHLSSELSVELFIKELKDENSDISKAFETNRELRDEILVDNVISELSKQAERGLLKNSMRDGTIMDGIADRIKNKALSKTIKAYIQSEDKEDLTMSGLLRYIKNEGLLDNMTVSDKLKFYIDGFMAFNDGPKATLKFFNQTEAVAQDVTRSEADGLNEGILKFSAYSEADLNKKINKMLERKSGIKAGTKISKTRAANIGKNKGKFKFFLPPNAEDFMGLIYPLIGKGKQGDKDLEFIKETLIDPFNRAENEISEFRQRLSEDLKVLNKEMGDLDTNVDKEIIKELAEQNFTPTQAVRVFIWTARGEDIPDLTKSEALKLRLKVMKDKKLLKYAKDLMEITSKFGGYPPPSKTWAAGNVTADFYEYANENVRADILADWQATVDVMFNKENLNKMLAIFGKDYVKNLERSLQRMKSGKNRLHTQDDLGSGFLNFINGSIGVIMFMNIRSAVLQTISAVNFMNWTDNNPIKAAKTLKDPKNVANHFMRLLNSDFLKQRRAGLEIDVAESEIADAATEARNFAKSVFHKLIRLGYKPTQFADSFAIALGGTTFIINRQATYEAEGMTAEEAYEKAFVDFREIAEENQQSSRTDKVSNIQSSALGRLVFAFNNTPFQYTRIIKKATLDLINNRGDWRTNVSKIIYYGAAQNAIFFTLQQALFSVMFDDEEEEKTTAKQLRLANSMVDSILRGSGLPGAVVSTLKNTLIKYTEEEKKGWRGSPEKVVLELSSLSPPINYKAKKIVNFINSAKYSESTYDEVRRYGKLVSVANVPVDRILTKYDNLTTAMSGDIENWQRVALTLGWDKWSLDLYDKKKKKAKKTNNAIKTLKMKPLKMKPLKMKPLKMK